MLLKLIIKLTSIFLILTVTSCSQPVVNTSGLTQENSFYGQNNTNTALSGKVEFPDQFNLKATVGEVGSNATVSIIYPANHPTMAGKTVATGLTNNSGDFTITPDAAFTLSPGDIFRLEAIRRVAGTGTSEVTLNTYIRWNGTGWTSITTPVVKINKETTALTIIEMNDNSLNPDDLIGKISSVNMAYTQAGNITPQIYSDVTGLVGDVLIKNLDPIQYIKWNGIKAVITNPLSVTSFQNDLITYSEVVQGSGGNFPPYCDSDPFADECYGSPAYCMYDPGNPVCQGQGNFPPYCDFQWYFPECYGSPGYCMNSPGDPVCEGQGTSSSADAYAIDPDNMNKVQLIHMTPQQELSQPTLLGVTANGKNLILKYTQYSQERIGTLSTSIANQQQPYVISTNISSTVNDFIASPVRNLFAFTSNNKLYVTNGTIGNLKLASPGIGQNGITNLKWSPDSKKVLFAAHNGSGSRYNLYVFNSDSGNTVSLSDTVSGPTAITAGSWSPDSAKIVFEATNGTRNDLYIANTGGGAPLLITGGTALSNDKPKWSPDSGKVLWRRQNSANDYDWYVSNTEVPVIQTNLTGNYSLSNTTTYDNTRNWAPDSLKVCFDASNGTRTDTYVGDLSQNNTFIITPANVQSESGGVEPKFSKDSAKVIVRAKDASNRFDLFSVSLPGNNSVNLTSGLGNSNRLFGGYAEDPSGNKLLISSVNSFYTANNDGSGLTALSNLNGYDELFWYPNGRRIVFTRSNDIHVVNPDNTGYANITNDSTNPKTDVKIHIRN
jgi:Tol biopolymer transport system component